MKDARWPMHMGIIFESRSCFVSARRDSGQESSNNFSVSADIIPEEKGAMTACALDIAVADWGIIDNQSIDKVSGLIGREQPVCTEAQDQPTAFGRTQCLGQLLRCMSEVEKVHGHGKHEVAVGIEALDKLGS